MLERTDENSADQLSLALFARQAIEALLELIEKGGSERLAQSLTGTVESLNAAANRRQATTQPAKAFRRYAQALTLDEVLPAEERQDMATVLQKLVSGSTDREEARRAITFFYKLENRALRNVNLLSRP